jgi:catechol 2,3-dioxygenase-like lactoylglutathione lyase family enzyme
VSDATTSPGTRITEVRTVAVPVSDQEQAIEFYVGKLGFEKRVDTGYGAGERWVEVAPPGGRTSIALVRPGDAGTGIDTGIRLSTEDADTDHASLKAGGVDVDAEIMRWGGPVPPMFTFRDPDGNRLTVVENMPGM